MQISPEMSEDKGDTIDRVCIPHYPSIARRIQDNHNWYRGYDIKNLNSQLENVLERSRNCRALIVICCHGGEDGSFTDEELLWTPHTLWNGQGHFIGLQNAIQKSSVKRIDIVFAQCHGKYFADEMQDIIPIFMFSRVYIHGLSYGDTERRSISLENDRWLTTQQLKDWEAHNKNLNVNEKWQLSSKIQHMQLVQWFARNVPDGLKDLKQMV